MITYIRLFRALNVGGRNIISMKDLTSLPYRVGCIDIKTYIQSGNVILQSHLKNRNQSIETIRKELKNSFGFMSGITALP